MKNKLKALLARFRRQKPDPAKELDEWDLDDELDELDQWEDDDAMDSTDDDQEIPRPEELPPASGSAGLWAKLKEKIPRKQRSSSPTPPSMETEQTDSLNDEPDPQHSRSLGQQGFLSARARHNWKEQLKSFALTMDIHGLGELLQKFYAPGLRPRLHRFFISVLVVSGFYGMGKISALLLGGRQTINVHPVSIETAQLRQFHFDEVLTNNLFNALLEKEVDTKLADKKPTQVKFDPNALCISATQNTGLPLTLMNTVVLQDSVKSVASVQLKQANKILSLREGDTIEQMAKVGRINRLGVILRNLKSGACERLENSALKTERAPKLQILSPQAGKKLMDSIRPDGISNEGNNYKISRKIIGEKLKSINEVLKQARAIQLTNPDGTLSFKMTEVEPGSIYTFIGIQNDDKISRINGEPIANLNEIFNLFGKLQKLNDLSLTVERDGQQITLDYSFTK